MQPLVYAKPVGAGFQFRTLRELVTANSHPRFAANLRLLYNAFCRGDLDLSNGATVDSVAQMHKSVVAYGWAVAPMPLTAVYLSLHSYWRGLERKPSALPRAQYCDSAIGISAGGVAYYLHFASHVSWMGNKARTAVRCLAVAADSLLS